MKDEKSRYEFATDVKNANRKAAEKAALKSGKQKSHDDERSK